MILRFAFEKLFKAREAANRVRQQKVKPGADDGFDPFEKPFLEHLEDLRKSLGKMLVTVLVATVLAFIFNIQIFEFIQLPAKIATLNKGTPEEVSLHKLIDFLTLSPPEILMLSIKTAFFAALIASFPLLVWFAGEFILPGLKQAEKRYVVPGVGIGFLLFLIGASFAFFLAAPIALKFFYGFYADRVGILKPGSAQERVEDFLPVYILQDGAKPAPVSAAEDPGPEAPALDQEMKSMVRDYINSLLVVEKGSNLALYFDPARDKLIITSDTSKMVSYRIGEYISFITRITLVFGLSFQLPVVVVILVKLELLTARVMRSTRSYAWVVILIAAAIFTPPDLVTLTLLGGPLVILYEICIWIAWGMEKRRERIRLAEEKTREAERQQRLERLAMLREKSREDLSEEEKEEIHRDDIEQYERDHAHLYLEESGHPVPRDPHASPGEDPHHPDPHHPDPYHPDPYHSDPYHSDPYHDEHGHPYDPHHDESWGQDHAGEEHPGEESEPVPAGDGSGHPEPDDFAECEPAGPVVNLNSATAEELLTLPGVGPAMAERIIERRPYRSFDDVLAVPGISDQKLQAMIERLSVSEPEPEDEDQPPAPGT